MFGTVQEGNSKSLSIDLDYAGRSDWKVHSVSCNDSFVKANISEISRKNGLVKYRIDATLGGDAPKGPILSELIIKTNDRNLTTVPLRLIANVQATISVTPQLMAIGDIKQGEPITQILILKGQEPFTIKTVKSDDFDVNFQQAPEAKQIHKLEMTLSPKAAEGEVKGKIFVTTDLHGETTVAVDATCKVCIQ